MDKKIELIEKIMFVDLMASTDDGSMDIPITLSVPVSWISKFKQLNDSFQGDFMPTMIELLEIFCIQGFLVRYESLQKEYDSPEAIVIEFLKVLQDQL